MLKLKLEKFYGSAKEEASLALKEINQIYDNIDNTSIKNINKIRNNLNDSIKQTSINSATQIINDNKEKSLSISDIKVGMNVLIKSLNQVGIVTALPNKSNQIQVQVGSTKLNLKIDDLGFSNKSQTKNNSSPGTHFLPKNSKSKDATTQINVIGYTVDDAIFVIDKYLDDCYIAKLKTVRIVHGKGTGALRTGIHTFLKKHHHVKSFRLGTFGEGENGVTVVELS